MNIKPSKGEIIFNVFNNIFLAVLSFVCLYPMLYVLFASLSESSRLMSFSGALLRPLGFQLNAYVKVFQNQMIFVGYKNTLLVMVGGVLINMILTILGAYFLSRKKVYFRNAIMTLILITMYFSGGLIPTYLTVKSLGMENTLWALFLPSAVNTYNLIIMITGFSTVPDSLEEAAKIDGANAFEILVKVYIPLIKPTLAVIVLYYSVANWNSWFNAAIYLNSREKYPLQLILREILISSDTSSMNFGASASDAEGVSMSIKYATIIVSTLPILIVYPFVQKYFVTGMMIGSVKG